MTRSTAPWTTALATAALLGLPAGAWAQTPAQTPAQDPQVTATEQRDARAADEATPEAHLRQAKEALDQIDKDALSAADRSRLQELRGHLTSLERELTADRSGAVDDSATAVDTEHTAPQQAAAPADADRQIAEIERILSQMLGEEDATTAGTAGAVGTTGTTEAPGVAGTTGETELDATTRAQLMEVRRHITALSTALEAGTAAYAGTGTVPHEPEATGTTGTATPTPPEPAEPDTPQDPAATSPQPQPDQTQVDPQSAREHLTAARNTLSELTQLPAAAQLTGETRMHVSQLIQNFNELITTEEDWQGSYAKLQANLDALLDGETMARPEPTEPTQDPEAAVGTTGEATQELDPQIRQKLIEFRQHLERFEQAAGAQAAGQHAQAGFDRDEALRHIRAIEEILNRQAAQHVPADRTMDPGVAGTTGTTMPETGAPEATAPATAEVRLSQAEVQQLRSHLEALRRLVEQR